MIAVETLKMIENEINVILQNIISLNHCFTEKKVSINQLEIKDELKNEKICELTKKYNCNKKTLLSSLKSISKSYYYLDQNKPNNKEGHDKPRGGFGGRRDFRGGSSSRGGGRGFGRRDNDRDRSSSRGGGRGFGRRDNDKSEFSKNDDRGKTYPKIFPSTPESE